MKEAGTPFTAAMVRAVLDGSKTQTRRLPGLEKINTQPGRWSVEHQGLIDMPGAPYTGKRGVLFRDTCGERLFVPARYASNTILWVREAWRLPVTLDEFSGQDVDLRTTLAGGKAVDLPIEYEADGGHRNWNGDFEPGRYRHGRFMPRWASRIDLQYVGERVERLQDCSEADAEAEGWPAPAKVVLDTLAPLAWYRNLWESINGPGSWAANPWVWVIEFRRIGQVRKEA